MRTVRLLNDDWWFAPEPLNLNAPVDLFESVALPHTNRLFLQRTVNSEDYQFISTYRKHFRLPEALNGRRVFLDFDGAMAASTVYLNNQRVGEHLGGYTPFSLDVTPYLTDGDNVLIVFLDSTERPDIPPFGNVLDYLTFGGLYRDVRLRMVDPCHIQQVFARPVHVLTAPGLECDLQISEYRPGLSVQGQISDLRGQVIASAQCALSPERSTFRFPAPLAVDLWSLDHPALYTLTLTLSDSSGPLDTVHLRTGFREAEFRPEDGFFLNGEPLKLMGLNRHQTYPYIGAAAPARLQRQDADILKYELGCNVVRTSHYPQSPYFLDRCDEIGLLVFEEIPGWQHIGDAGWQALVLRDVKAMIERDRNRPSVILWGVRINESPDHADLYTRTNALARELDPTRATGGVRDFLASEFLEDVFTYNDFSNSVASPTQQPHLITEFAGHMFPTKSWDSEERRVQHALLHARVQNLQRGSDRIAGAIGWCAFDYHTHREFGSGDRICHHGVMDMFRLPKWAAYFYASQRPPEQSVVLKAATHWTMGDRSGGGNNPLTVFSNCDEIEVFIGAFCVGRFQPDRESYAHLAHPPFTIRWPEPYNPWGQAFDDLIIVGYLKGKAVAEHRIDSCHRAHALTLAADVDQLQADGADMTRLVVGIIDRYDNILPYAIHVVQFELEGEATLIGQVPLPLVGGQAALYVKAGRRVGPIRITASTPGLPSASVILNIENPRLPPVEGEEQL